MADSSIHKPQDADLSSDHPVLNDEEDDTVEVDTLGDSAVAYVEDETAEPLHDFVDFEVYWVNNAIVRRARKEIYNRTSGLRLHESLIERQDIKYQGFNWALQFSWVNESNTPNTYTRTVQEGLTIREGQETELNFGVSASFKGIGVEAGGVRKEFSERETSRLETIQKGIIAEPQAHTFFYQKRYNFLTEVWFWQRVPDWQFNHFGIGRNGAASQLVKRTAVTSIFAEEYATLHRRLSGTTTILGPRNVPRLPDDPPSNRQFQNITQRAKDTLARWNIRG